MQAWKTDHSNGTHWSVLNEVCWAEMNSDRNDHNLMHGLKLKTFKSIDLFPETCTVVLQNYVTIHARLVYADLPVYADLLVDRQ